MDFDEYQRKAARTINKNLSRLDATRHAIFGLTAEAGEIASLYQKEYQGHAIEIEALGKEIGDVLWMLAELCTMTGLTMGNVAQANITKLEKRYPQGFSIQRSLHRAAGDI